MKRQRLMGLLWLIIVLLLGGGNTYLYSNNHYKRIQIDLHQGEENLSGKVVYENGEPIVGATVLVIGTTKGTITDMAGEFSITVSTGDEIKVSFVGCKDAFFKVENFDDVIISLQEKEFQLNEIVVVGYAKQRKINLTGSVTSVSTDDLESRPITNSSMALAGKAAGVQVTQNSGKPGEDDGTIRIRGIGTLNNANPLVIVDGFEGSFTDVNPKDIESISILKDAASSSIYGNKAANGVILITTKKGTEGKKTTISYDGYQSVQEITRFPDLLNSVQYMELKNEAYINSGYSPAYTEEYINNWKNGNDPVRYRDYQWKDWYFQPAPETNHSLQIRGGTKKIDYLISSSYLGQKGVIEGTQYDKFSFRANLGFNFFNNRLNIKTNLSGYIADKDDVINGTGAVIRRISQMTPMVEPKIEGYGWTDWFYEDAIREAGGGYNTDYNQLNTIIGLNFKITKDLVLDGAFNYVNNIELQRQYAPNVTLYSVQRGDNGNTFIGESGNHESFIKKGTYNYGSLSSYATLNYSKQLRSNHNFKFLAGIQQYSWNGHYYDVTTKRLVANLPYFSSGDAETTQNSDWGSEVNDISYFGRFNYVLKERYLFEGNIRYDGASRFAKDHKWGAFPSVSAGWLISEENFFGSLKNKIQMLKVRGSWGRLGNQNINNSYAGADILSIGNSNYVFGGSQQTGAAVSYIANPSLSWETTTQSNIGLDITFLKSWNFVADAYIKKTQDILMQIPVSSTFGYTVIPYQNVGKLTNKGIELTMNYKKHFPNDFTFNWTGSVSYNENKITDLAGRSPIIRESEILKEGLPYNSLYGFETEGIYQSEHEIQSHLKIFDDNGNVVNAYNGLIAKPGDIRFKDQNGDGYITMDQDRVCLGNSNPDYIFSTIFNMKYKNFDLSVFLEGTQGAKGWNGGTMVVPFFNGSYNAASWVTNRWTSENPNNEYQRVFIDNQRSTIRSEYFVEDMSYVRLKNLELAYNIPAQLTKDFIEHARVFVSASNLFTLTRYKGFDPEQIPNANNFSNEQRFPQTKKFTVGLNLSF